MAKDPAILFYTSDFLTDTTLMSFEDRGKYITLWCIQHQKGHIKHSDMVKICGSEDSDVFKMFQKDADNLYYHIGLEEIITKRKAYSESRANNRRTKKTSEDKNTYLTDMKAYLKDMENENENIIIDRVNNSNYSEPFKNYLIWQFKHGKLLMKMQEPLLESEYLALMKDFSANVLSDVVNAMANHKQLAEKYTSTYSTIRSWADRRVKNPLKTDIEKVAITNKQGTKLVF